MPNWCYSGIEADFADKESAELAMVLIRLLDDTPSHKTGMDMGMINNGGAVDNWLFDRQWSTHDNVIIVTGNVRWGFNQSHIIGLVNWWLAHGAEKISVDYEEISGNMLGEYLYEDGELTQKYLPDNHPWWAKYHSGEDDEFDGMDSAPREDDVTRTIATKIGEELCPQK